MVLDPDLTFKVANTVALLGWVALAASPPQARWAPSMRRWTGLFLPLGLALLYAVLLAGHWRGQGGFGSVAQVRAMFDVPGVLVAGWVHYLAFDLFVGGWIAERAAMHRWPHVLTVLLLGMTFMLGPLGLLAYAALRSLQKSRQGQRV